MADAQIQHLLRRAGFGSTPDELANGVRTTRSSGSSLKVHALEWRVRP